jgi:glycerol-3-phosphate O-acyltransferase
MSSYHQAVCDVIGKLDLFLEKYYSSINLCGPELDATQYQRHPLMFACTHRSHMDYILVGYKLHKKGFKNMRFAAGITLPSFLMWGPDLLLSALLLSPGIMALKEIMFVSFAIVLYAC